MSEITVTIPPDVEEKARALASAQGLTLENYIATTLAHEVLTNEWLAGIQARRGKVTGERFLELLNKASDNPPMPGDEIPPDLRERLESLRKQPK